MRSVSIACAFALASGCGGQPAAPTGAARPAVEPAASGGPRAPADGTRDDGHDALSAEPLESDIAGRWWAEDEPCPDGARLRGAAPPEGAEVWCERGESERHGPSTAWHAGGSGKASEGRYLDGDQHGVWSWWSAGDAPWRQIEFDRGQRDGRVILWNDEGQVTRVEMWERGTRTRATDFEDGRPVAER